MIRTQKMKRFKILAPVAAFVLIHQATSTAAAGSPINKPFHDKRLIEHSEERIHNIVVIQKNTESQGRNLRIKRSTFVAPLPHLPPPPPPPPPDAKFSHEKKKHHHHEERGRSGEVGGRSWGRVSSAVESRTSNNAKSGGSASSAGDNHSSTHTHGGLAHSWGWGSRWWHNGSENDEQEGKYNNDGEEGGRGQGDIQKNGRSYPSGGVVSLLTNFDNDPEGTCFKCNENDPCEKDHDIMYVRGQFFPSCGSSSSFIRCDVSGECHEVECAEGTTWDQSIMSCVHVAQTEGDVEGYDHYAYADDDESNSEVSSDSIDDDTYEHKHDEANDDPYDDPYDEPDDDIYPEEGETQGLDTEGDEEEKWNQNKCFNCDDKNPCVHQSTHLYFADCESASSFIQCDLWGQCFEQQCPTGTIWNQALQVCSFELDQSYHNHKDGNTEEEEESVSGDGDIISDAAGDTVEGGTSRYEEAAHKSELVPSHHPERKRTNLLPFFVFTASIFLLGFAYCAAKHLIKLRPVEKDLDVKGKEESNIGYLYANKIDGKGFDDDEYDFKLNGPTSASVKEGAYISPVNIVTVVSKKCTKGTRGTKNRSIAAVKNREKSGGIIANLRRLKAKLARRFAERGRIKEWARGPNLDYHAAEV